MFIDFAVEKVTLSLGFATGTTGTQSIFVSQVTMTVARIRFVVTMWAIAAVQAPRQIVTNKWLERTRKKESCQGDVVLLWVF